MTVKHVTSMDEYKTALETSKTKLVVIDFSAVWCGPCKFISPVFEKMSEEMPEVEFMKVDVDDAEDVAAACSISAMPTFQFYRNGEKIDEMKGADANKLKALIAQHK